MIKTLKGLYVHIYTTHEYELRGRRLESWGVQGRVGIKGIKNWENCNSIINKIYLKIKINKIFFKKKEKKTSERKPRSGWI